MIVQEVLEENPDLIKTYSNDGRYVVNQDGVAYGEAIDLVEFIEKGTISYTEGDLIPLPPEEDAAQITPEQEELKNTYVNAIQLWMDMTVQERGYDNIASVCTYANEHEPNPKFKAEGYACLLWRSSVWTNSYRILDEVLEGKREIPTITELIEELPSLEW